MGCDIRVENLSIKTRDGMVLVRDVSFAFGSNNPICLIGETGSGKSLVMHAIMGSLPEGLICEGAILLDGENLLALSAAERRRLWGRTFSLLPQEPSRSLDPTMTIRSQVAEIYPALHGMPWKDATARAEKDLQAVGLDHAAKSFPFELSGGMAQRASIAMAHAAGSMVLLADEPTKGLDRALCDVVAGMINHEVGLSRAVMVITHDLELAMQTTGMIGVMRNGVLLEVGKAESVLDAPHDPYTRSLVAALPSHWQAVSRAGNVSGEVVIAARNLGKSFGEKALFTGLDLTLRAGEITVALGPSGCGKSTLGNILLGLIKADQGTVEKPRNLPGFKYQKIYQDPPAGFIPHQTLGNAFADLRKRHGIDGALINKMLEGLGLDAGLLARHPDGISGGELQRFAIARALLLSPAMLFADEATSRLDPVSQKRVIDLLVAQVRERDLALMLVTHDHVLAHKIADHVIDLGDAGQGVATRNVAA